MTPSLLPLTIGEPPLNGLKIEDLGDLVRIGETTHDESDVFRLTAFLLAWAELRAPRVPRRTGAAA